jgi:hypothetical protein
LKPSQICLTRADEAADVKSFRKQLLNCVASNKTGPTGHKNSTNRFSPRAFVFIDFLFILNYIQKRNKKQKSFFPELFYYFLRRIHWIFLRSVGILRVQMK